MPADNLPVPIVASELLTVADQILEHEPEWAEPGERCPSATGQPFDEGAGCTVHADQAHHCHLDPKHIQTHDGQHRPATPLERERYHPAEHVCDCGFMWITYGGALEDLSGIMPGVPGPGWRSERIGAGAALRRVWDLVTGPDPMEAADALGLVARQYGVRL